MLYLEFMALRLFCLQVDKLLSYDVNVQKLVEIYLALVSTCTIW